jgi:hypothetical protein
VTSFVLMLRLGLALLYVVAAVGKLLSRQSARQLAESFRLEGRLAVVVRALPLAELALAGGLVFGVTARGAGVASCLLLVVFSMFVVRNLRQGRAEECHCFGKFHRSRIGWPMLLRNGLLAIASALIAAWVRHPGATSLFGGSAVAGGGAWLGGALVAAVAGWLTIVRIRRARAANRESPAIAGAQSPGVGDLSREALLVFVRPGCGPCEALMRSLRRWWNDVEGAQLRIVVNHPPDLGSELLADLPADSVVIDEDESLAHRYGIDATPSAVVLAAHTGTVKTVAVGLDQVERLVRQVVDPAALRESDAEHVRLEERLARWRLGPLALTRRQIAAGGLGWLFAMLLPASGVARGLTGRASTGRGVRCPSCGKCTICQTKSGKKKLACRPCREKCSARRLCAGYANKFASYRSIAAYLESNGFTQSKDPVALGLEHRQGKLEFFGTYTEFTSSSSKTPKAILVYGLTNNNQFATAALLDRGGRGVSVVTTNASGQAVATQLPTGSSAAPGSNGSPTPTRADAFSGRPAVAAGGPGCADRCKLAYGYLAATAVILGASDPAAPVFLLGMYLLTTTMSLAGKPDSYLATGTNVLVAAVRMKDVFDALASGGGILGKLGMGSLCDEVCSWELEGCCSYGGGCWNSLGTCASKCPESLAHQAPCLVYVSQNGKRVYLGRF